MSSIVLFSAILISLLCGYVIADLQGSKFVLRRWRKFSAKFFKHALRAEDSHYYGVLTKLLNEQPDEALDHFISKMEVNEETLEMHLALGSLLRRRGEFDRAVRVHQNLLTRPGLPIKSIHQVQLELASDFWRSGLLDRAETLLKELMQVAGVNKGTRWQAAAYLVEIYQDLGEWLQAIDIADQLTSKKFADEPDFWRRLQAQYCCELAELALARQETDFVSQKVRQALAFDSECIRAHLIRADISAAQGDHTSALIALDSVAKLDASFLSETLNRFRVSLDSENLLEHFSSLQQKYPSITLVIALLNIYIQKQDYASGQVLIDSELERIPNIESELQVLKYVTKSEFELDERLLALSSFLTSKQRYSCIQCGAHHEQMTWLCPSCQSWSTVRLSPL